MIPAKNRERKCSTCKHYQPSPLWRKGWCRNPLLYDRNTNHLVEAESLACNRTFIDYWEPADGPPADGRPTRGTKPRIAPSIPMDTKDAQGRSGVVTGNTPAVGMPAVNPRQLYKPVPGRGRPPLSIVTPEFEDNDDALLDPSKETRQIEKVTDGQPTARQRIQKARSQRRFTLLGMSGRSLWVPLGIVAALMLLGGFAVIANNRQQRAVATPTATASVPAPSPTGYGEPTATVPVAAGATTTVAVPPGVIAIGAWVQVTGAANGLTVREAPSTTGSRITALAEGTKARVVDGPETADNLTWWKITGFSKTNPDLEGWSAETYLKATTAP